MKREVFAQIIDWKNTPNDRRKPLILEGARQTGKTWLARELGKTEFSIEKRFEEHKKDSRYETKEKRPLYAAFQKYGVENFSFEIQEECSIEELNKKDEEIKKLIYKEMERLINTKNGFKPFEKVGKFVFLDKPFEVGVELSPKQGIIRYKINELYKAKISLMYADSGLQAMLGSVLTSEAITNIQKNVQKKVQDLKNIIN